MTQEDKELSFIDISGRLHYGVIVNYKENEYDHRKWKITNLHTLSYSKSGTLIDTDWDGWISYEEHQGCGMSSGSRPFSFREVLPYLRPMSSMSKEEEDEWCGLNIDPLLEAVKERHTRIEDLMLRAKSQYRPLDWLNAHHFDFRNLIEKGLALEAPEDMYK